MSSRLLFVLSFLGALALGPAARAQTTVDLSVVGVRDSSFVRATAARQDTFFTVQGLRFRSVFDTSFGGFWIGGWAFSRSVDTTGSFTNLYGASGGQRPCCGPADETFLVGQQSAYILLPPGSSLAGFEYNNLAYTEAVVRRGSMFSEPFGKTPDGGTSDPDSLILSVCGYLDGLPTFVRDIALADYRFADDTKDFIVTDWTNVDLTPGGRFIETDSMSFRLKSSEKNAFGNTTPDFFAIGKLQAFLDVSAVRAAAAVRPVRVFPNPTVDYATVGEGGSSGELTIADATGRVVRHLPRYEAGSRVNVGDLGGGHYYLAFREAGVTYAAQLIVR